jgi:selenide,water dikinase
METEKLKLTQHSISSGCGCKIHPQALQEILTDLPKPFANKNLLVGYDLADDASAYDLGNDLVLLQTADFFTPITDDPYLFGQVAACNALSDIYAMGGKPIMANALLGWPVKALGTEMAKMVMKGASDTCLKAEVSLAGGHSIDITQPVFGLSVTGTVAGSNLKTNAGAKPGDLLILTKPLGIGILSASAKREKINEEGTHTLTKILTQLNDSGTYLGKVTGVHAMTDVTGFSFSGHLLEMCKASGLSVRIAWNCVPLIPQALEYAALNILPDNAFRNWNSYEAFIQNWTAESFPFLCDPQTNGGLLIAFDPAVLSEVTAILKSHQSLYSVIGRFESAELPKIILE